MISQARKDKLSFNDEYSFIEWVLDLHLYKVA